jgi:hemolysin activation/secretion protein
LGASVDDSAQLLAFYDAGFVSYVHAQPSLPRSTTLQSTGVGARFGIGRYLDVRFDYGWQLRRAPGAAHTGNMAEIALTLSY